MRIMPKDPLFNEIQEKLFELGVHVNPDAHFRWKLEESEERIKAERDYMRIDRIRAIESELGSLMYTSVMQRLVGNDPDTYISEREWEIIQERFGPVDWRYDSDDDEQGDMS